MLDQHPAARAEWKAFDVMVLCGVGGDVEHGLRRRAHVTDRQAADLSGGRQIGFHQRGRHRQCAGDVVEPARRVVRRQELGSVHFERKQIANRVGVLGAIETMQSWRRQMLRRVGVQAGLHEAEERLHRGRIRPARVGRGHEARAHFANDFFRQLGVIRETREVQLVLVQDQPAGLEPRVVAGDTVLIHQRARRRSFLTSRRGHRLYWSGCLRGCLLPRNRARCGPGRGRGLARLSNNHSYRQRGHAACHQDSRHQAFPHALITRTD